MPALFALLVAGIGISVRQAASEPAPNHTWAAYYNGTGSSFDFANALAVDAAGNAYVTGAANGNYVTVKYGPNGVRLWAAQYDGPAHGADTAAAVGVDSSGNVYVTGGSYGGSPGAGGTDYDITTVKYNSAGVEQWVRRYNGNGNQDDAGRGLAIDARGNVFVAGYTWTGVSAWDYITLKYEADGTERWTANYDAAMGADRAVAVAVDADGSVYVTGESFGVTGGADYATIKYAADGGRVWVARYDGPLHGADSPTAIRAAPDGGAWVTGATSSPTITDCATIRYAANGTQLWIGRFNGPGNGSDAGLALTSDAQENVYVAGFAWASASGYDYLTLKYSPQGAAEWSAIYTGAGGGDDLAKGIAVTGDGAVYVTGQAGAGGASTGYATLKYSSAGNAEWTARFNGTAVGPGGGTALTLGPDESLYVTGNAWTTGGQDLGTLRYPPAPPAAPGNLRAVGGNGQVALTWEDHSSAETGFKLERKTGAGSFTLLTQTAADATAYTDATTAAGGAYTYRVRATGVGVESAPSNTATVTLPGGTPGKLVVTPKKLNFATVRLGKRKIKKLTVKNTGRGVLFGQVNLASGSFTLEAGAGAFSLAPKKSLAVQVSFEPEAAGLYPGVISVQSDDPRRALVSINLVAKAR